MNEKKTVLRMLRMGKLTIEEAAECQELCAAKVEKFRETWTE